MGIGFRVPFERRDDSMMMAAITPEGKHEAEAYASGGPKFDVLATLNEHSPLTIRGICRETNLDIKMVKHILNELMRDGFVRKVKAGGMLGDTLGDGLEGSIYE